MTKKQISIEGVNTMPDRGYVHVYTGNGKGKTTASLGLALRAICSGKKSLYGAVR